MLTGLLNKRSYELFCDSLIGNLPQGRRCTLFVLDVDRFKSFNDTYGHARGDEVLRLVADALRSSLRTDDKLGRIGGDEFSAFIVTDGSNAITQQKVSLICRTVEEQSKEKLGMRVTFSVGAATFSVGGVSYMDAFKSADAALYTAKHSESKSFEINKLKK